MTTEKPILLQEHDLIVSLYTMEKISPEKIAKQLTWAFETKVTKHDVYKFLKVRNLLRTVKEASSIESRGKRFWKPTQSHCKCCGCVYDKLNNRQRCCKICVPNKKAADRLRFYGINQVEFDNLLQKQRNECAVCYKNFSNMTASALHIDHCHTTNQVRGLVCRQCNLGLAFVDKKEWLESAIRYVTR